FEHGVDGTGIHPGIIGEIGTDQAWVSPREERVFRAVVRAATRTGLAVSTHAIQSQVGLDQLRILEEEGLDLGRVVVGHADSILDIDYALAVLDRGASIEFDLLGRPGDYAMAREVELVELVVELLERGYASQILLSHDISSNAQLKAYGGAGFGYVAQHFLPHLRTGGGGGPAGRPARRLSRPFRLVRRRFPDSRDGRDGARPGACLDGAHGPLATVDGGQRPLARTAAPAAGGGRHRERRGGSLPDPD